MDQVCGSAAGPGEWFELVRLMELGGMVSEICVRRVWGSWVGSVAEVCLIWVREIFNIQKIGIDFY